MSDLHLEFHADKGASFVEELPVLADVLVLAGDICSVDLLIPRLSTFAKRWPHVVYVHGNHEFYGSDRSAVLERMLWLVPEFQNLHWLDSGEVEIEGQRLLGSPMWFPPAPNAPKWAMSDFSEIRDFEKWVYRENARAIRFFDENLSQGDVVVTHHLPSQKSVAPIYVGNPLNPYFVCDVTPMIQRLKPKLWIHGHTHTTRDYKIGPTRVVCNPLGYPGEPVRGFDEALVIDI